MASRSIIVISILLGMVAAGVASSDDHHARVTKYWEEKLPGVAMPASLHEAISPIEGTALADLFAMHMEHGTFYPSTSASFCKMAGLVCGHKGKAAQLDKGAYNYKAAGEVNDGTLAPSKGYFLATDLVKGATMRLREQPHRQPRAFLPSIVADILPPLSTPLLSETLQRIFNIHKGTEMYAALDFAIDVCHDIPGEERACPTSLQSLVDFASSHLGSDVKVLTSSPRPRTVMGPMKVKSFTEYSVHHGQNVVCHVLDFPSQLYMCHLVPDTKVFEASLTDADGAVTRAVGCCHLNTKSWNPEHQSFKILGVKPGTPVCHWSSDDTLVWVSANSKVPTPPGHKHDHTAM